MAPLGGVWWEWWTVLRLSQTVDVVCECFLIIVLSLKHATMDRPRVGCRDASVGDHLAVGAIVPHLDQGVHVGVVRGVVVHAPIIGTRSGDLGATVDTFPDCPPGVQHDTLGGSNSQ